MVKSAQIHVWLARNLVLGDSSVQFCAFRPQIETQEKWNEMNILGLIVEVWFSCLLPLTNFRIHHQPPPPPTTTTTTTTTPTTTVVFSLYMFFHNSTKNTWWVFVHTNGLGWQPSIEVAPSTPDLMAYCEGNGHGNGGCRPYGFVVRIQQTKRWLSSKYCTKVLIILLMEEILHQLVDSLPVGR